MSSTENNPLYGMFAGMMSQFFREAMASGNYSTVTPNSDSGPAPTPLPTLAVPAAVPYTSSRSLALPAASNGHPIPSTLSPASLATQPMLGVSGLAIPLAGGHSNSARRARLRDLTTSQISRTNAGRVSAAAAHLGVPGQALPPRRRRGPAVRGVVLHQGPQTTLEKVSSFNPAGVREIRVTNLVQPFQTGQEVVLYKNFRAAHQHYLATNQLAFDYNVSENTSVSSILQMSSANMRVGTRHYAFGPLPAGPSTRLQHEALELQALVYVNNAKNRGDGAAHLRRESITAELTLKDLFEPALKNLYAPPLYCVQGDRFILHSIVRYPGLTFVETIDNAWPRRHGCLTKRHNLQFSEAVEMDWGDDDGASDTSGGVPESDQESDDENAPIAPILTAPTPPALPQRRAPLSTTPTAASSANIHPASVSAVESPVIVPAGSVTNQPLRPSTQPIAAAWPTTSWVPESTALYRDIFERNDVPAAIYQAATDGSSLELEGPSIDALAAYYVETVRDAAAKGDYSPLLRARRRVRVLKPDGTIFSFGSGVESEVIYTALNLYLMQAGTYCFLTDEDRFSLGVSMPLRLASAITTHRLDDMRVFGALLALSLISGKGVGDISPALIQYALNYGNPESLTPSFVSAWNPRLDRVVRQLQAVGPDGDLGPFQSLLINALNMQIAPLRYRDQNQHNMLVTQVVHTSLLGPDVHGHPEMKAFMEGLELPCTNGFSFGKLARSYPGGTEFFIAHAWTSNITDYDSLEPHLLITAPPLSAVTNHWGASAATLEPEAIFTAFLRRAGSPCAPGVLADAKQHLHPDVVGQLHQMDSPSFRSRMLCWAATGSPFLAPDAAQNDPIHVSFVLPNDQHYSDSAINSIVHMQQGTISFRSCSQVVRIPMSKLVEFHQTPEAFEQQVDSWFFLEILNGIGKISLL
ncbi:hypothetical protein B0H16DRAFT_1800603 [Mycena metata]|uniref:Uncharacterized protein n=1 Tax=Mycena metata TaxID=1033252 RepID=A0AAD7HC40_9AGAR|nr:hypothetical protein B0H16DRAFT_1800603 [Mycena metata]